MAVPSYLVDLTDLSLMEATTDVSALGGGAAGLSADPDFAIQGTNSVTKQVSTAGTIKGMVYDSTTPPTLGANDHIFVWVYATCPGLLELLANGGMRVTIGTDTSNYNDYYVAGKDTFLKGGHRCWPVRYTTAAPTPGAQTGTPGASPQVFGGQLHVTGILRADNLAVDAIRFGTGAYITAGAIATPITFAGFAAQNDLVANSWGVFSEVQGSYLLQGKFVVGQTTAGVPTLAYLDDPGADIIIVDTPHSLTDFTQIIVDHASTEFHTTNMNIRALGTNNPGQIIFNNAATVASIDKGVWADLGIITLQAAVVLTDVIIQRCGLITQNSATLTDCTIDDGAGVLSNNPTLITGCNFPGGGIGHALECNTIGTYGWVGNTDTGYTGTRGSNMTPASGSANAMFYNNSGGLITLNVSGGGQSPSVRNGAGATTVVVQDAPISITVYDRLGAVIVGARVAVYDAADVTEGNELLNDVTNGSGVATAAYNYLGDLAIVVRVRHSTAGTRYFPVATSGTILAAGYSTNIVMDIDSIAQ